MEINFSDAEKVIYDNKEAICVYVGNTKVWDIEKTVNGSGYTKFKIVSPGELYISNNKLNTSTIEKVYMNGNKLEDFPTYENIEFKLSVVTGDIFEIRGPFELYNILKNKGTTATIEFLSLQKDLTTIHGMLARYESEIVYGLDKLNTINITDMGATFSSCINLTSLEEVSNWDVSNVTNMGHMFGFCNSLTSLDLSKWNVSNVTTMETMFVECSKLKSLNVADWNVSNVTNMNHMFGNCDGLTSLDLSKWNVKKVTDISGMFYYCRLLTEVNLSNWDVSNVTNMDHMFYGCYELKLLNLSGWDTSNVENYDEVFTYVTTDCQIIIDKTKFINKSTGTTFTPQELGWTGTFTYL